MEHVQFSLRSTFNNCFVLVRKGPKPTSFEEALDQSIQKYQFIDKHLKKDVYILNGGVKTCGLCIYGEKVTPRCMCQKCPVHIFGPPLLNVKTTEECRNTPYEEVSDLEASGTLKKQKLIVKKEIDFLKRLQRLMKKNNDSTTQFVSLQQKAEFIHETNRLFAKIFRSSVKSPAWKNYGAKNQKHFMQFLEKLERGIVPLISPEQSHHDWMESKLQEGWRYGEIYNFKKKTHPNLVPYRNLPVLEKCKDILFLKLVEVMKSLNMLEKEDHKEK